ncbi:ribonuclease H-like domain-containing protein [Tanacetum coccineum]
MVTVRCIISLIVHNNWSLFQLDVNNAFPYADLHEDVYMDSLPRYYDSSETKVYKLVKSLYGLKQAPRQWNENHDKDVILALLVYVDDIVVSGNTLEEINKHGLCLSQRKYCLELLSEYGLLACKLAATPMQQNVSLSHIEIEKDKRLKSLTAYQKLHMHSALQSLAAGLRVLRSSVEAEYRCLASTTFEILWLVNLLKDLGVEGLLPVLLYCDITSAIQIAANPVFHEKTKHFEIDVHLVREKVASGSISIVKINSAKNVANVFNKGLSISQHK